MINTARSRRGCGDVVLKALVSELDRSGCDPFAHALKRVRSGGCDFRVTSAVGKPPVLTIDIYLTEPKG